MNKRAEHLIVDGFNVAHAWPDLRALLGKHLDSMVERLCSELRWVHDARGMRVTLVLDGRGPEIDVQHPFADLSFAVLYAPQGLSADGVIEQMAANSREPAGVFVATGDRAIAHSVEANGGSVVSAAFLRDWVDAAKRSSETRLNRRRAGFKDSFENRLPFGVRKGRSPWR